MNEQELVKLVTEKVIEALRQQEAASVPMPAALQAQPAAGAQSGSCTGESGLRMTVRDLRTRVAQSREGTRAHMEKLKSAKRHELTGRLPQDIADALEVMRRS